MPVMAFHTILDTEESVFHRLAYQKNASKRLCYRKWLMLFSLKLQRINQKMPYPWSPPRGKPEKKTVFSLNCGDEITTYYNRAFKKTIKSTDLNLYPSVKCCDRAKAHPRASKKSRLPAGTDSRRITSPPVKSLWGSGGGLEGARGAFSRKAPSPPPNFFYSALACSTCTAQPSHGS